MHRLHNAESGDELLRPASECSAARAHLDSDLFPERHVLHELDGALSSATSAQMDLRMGQGSAKICIPGKGVVPPCLEA